MWDSTDESLSRKWMLIFSTAHSTAANDKLFRVDAVADRWGREGEVCSDTRTARASGSKDMALGPCFARHDSYNSKNSGELFKETTDADKFGMYLSRSRRCKCPCPRLTLQEAFAKPGPVGVSDRSFVSSWAFAETLEYGSIERNLCHWEAANTSRSRDVQWRGKFLIAFEPSEMDESIAIADLQ